MVDNSILSLPQPCMLWPGRCWKPCLLGACFKEEGGDRRGMGDKHISCLFYLYSQQPGLWFLQVTSDSLLLNTSPLCTSPGLSSLPQLCQCGICCLPLFCLLEHLGLSDFPEFLR